MMREHKQTVDNEHNEHGSCWGHKKETGNKKKLYQCRECGFEYKKKEWAEKCQNWCKENKSCNLEITKYAVRKQK